MADHYIVYDLRQQVGLPGTWRPMNQVEVLAVNAVLEGLFLHFVERLHQLSDLVRTLFVVSGFFIDDVLDEVAVSQALLVELYFELRDLPQVLMGEEIKGVLDNQASSLFRFKGRIV